MITCQLMGGLGNQLFQIATTLALAWEHDDTAVFDLSGHRNVHQGDGARHYQNTIYRNLIDRKIWWSRHSFKEKGHHYQPIEYRPHLKLIGYFQSEKYFIKYRDRLLDTFAPTSAIVKSIESKYAELLSVPNCAIHVRRGDYLKFAQNHPPCSIEYYQQAMSHFDPETKFAIFSDDLDWCRNIFIGDRFIFCEGNSAEIDLYLMSMCQHQIMANSSFSWWGSWLNRHPHKRVISPKHWFGSKLAHLNTDDLYAASTLRL